MAGPTGGVTPQWSSRFAFLMAAIGSAVGLGNLWRFPFQTGQNGGSAFVFVYLICVAFIAYPILMGELAIGRHKGLSAVGSTKQLAVDIGKSPGWLVVGLAGVLAAFLVLTTYSVIAGQVMAYSLMSFMGEFAGRSAADAAVATSLYNGPGMALFWHTLFMGLTIFIVTRGLKGGIERVVTILMPIFFLMLIGLSLYALMTGAAGQAFDYLFSPRFSEITPGIVLSALGQAFFSIGVGGAIMMTYGSFLPKTENIGDNAAVIAGADTLVAIVAGLMIFPVVFAYALDPAAGMGLIFNALPAVFSGMPAGALIGGLFFFLAFIAALTSSISLLLVTSSVGEDQLGLGRTSSAIIFGLIAWVIGAMTIYIGGLGNWLDFFSGSVFLPLGGLLVAIFAGWIVPRAIMRGELHNTSDGVFRYWRFFIRYAAPIAVFLILILGIDAKFQLGLNAMLSGG
ncbi:sodium-dependent transporter [Hyphococcus sp.]|uniref:sodium-dependent transporter n=1 Tax=Hyphococcus sp. TaxID=2038636 RepID=UPI003CCBCCFD